jgi:hypothetical protein
MEKKDQEAITSWAAEKNRSPRLVLATSQDPISDRLTCFCDDFKHLVPQASVKKETDEAFRIPAIIIGRHANIAYQAVPLGRELAPFLKALEQADGRGRSLPSELVEKIGRLDLPVGLTLYIAESCPHCPHTVDNLLMLADSSPHFRLTVVDAGLQAQQAQADDIRSVPTVLMDGQWRWTGQVDRAELVDLATARDPARLSSASLRQMLETGQAERLAELMIAGQSVFPSYYELLVHERWSIRLGAMVTAEYLIERAPLLADAMAEQLIARFAGVSAQAQGDAAYLLGQIRSSMALEHLRAVADGSFDPMVKDAAAEALGQD